MFQWCRIWLYYLRTIATPPDGDWQRKSGYMSKHLAFRHLQQFSQEGVPYYQGSKQFDLLAIALHEAIEQFDCLKLWSSNRPSLRCQPL